MGKHSFGSNSAFVLADLLVRHVGRGKSVTVEQMADACGCSINAVYLAQKGTVGLNLGLAMLQQMPDEAHVEFFAAHGWDVHREEGPDGCLHEVSEEAAHTLAFYAKALRKRVLDHTAQMQLRRVHLPRLKAAIARCLRRPCQMRTAAE